ncbi:MAG: hypothetical protein C4519_20605 [Desulfobacteraceae bacterium]|nr:MAG: hypothetical protein C4519_20605 [Desulfobacteraceae bacterium]
MKCIDAIEGTVKSILTRIHTVTVEDNLDDTEYVRNVKAVIEATDHFIRGNPELVEDPQLLNDVLYRYSRNLWLLNLQGAKQVVSGPTEDSAVENEEYQIYYYDYLYHRGIYPR